MRPPVVPELGAELRGLRLCLGLSVTEVAARADVGRTTLLGWERGQSVPVAKNLARLLDAFGVDVRLRARLMYAVDPSFAGIELAHTTIGAPVDVGQAIRALRRRRKVTQTELARSLGLSQSAVARWESGDSSPDGPSLHALGFALGARPEEVAALSCAANVGGCEMPVLPDRAESYVAGLLAAPRELHDVILLGLEAELWRRSARDPGWDALFCRVAGTRAILAFTQGRVGEIEEPARRALRRGTTPEACVAATAAVSALVELAHHHEALPEAIAGRIGAWLDRLPSTHVNASWMVWERALCLSQADRGDEAAAETQRSLELLDRAVPNMPEDHRTWNHVRSMSETLVRAGRGEEAIPLWGDEDTNAAGELYRARLARGGRGRLRAPHGDRPRQSGQRLVLGRQDRPAGARAGAASSQRSAPIETRAQWTGPGS